MEPIALLLAAALNAGTVLAIAALGLLINEKAGVVNLGAEGMMLVSAIAGFAAVVHTGSDIAGFAAGMAAGAALAAVFGVLVVWLNTNAYATGLALSLFGAGFAAFAGIGYVQAKLPERAQFAIAGLADLPFVGPALFRQHPMVYLTVALTIALILWLGRTRTGLVLRAVGESPESAHALGYPVRRIRMGAVIGADHLCHLAPGTGVAWCLSVRWGHDAAVSSAEFRRAGAQPVSEYAALRFNNRRSGFNLAKSPVDPRQHACVSGQALHTGELVPEPAARRGRHGFTFVCHTSLLTFPLKRIS